LYLPVAASRAMLRLYAGLTVAGSRRRGCLPVAARVPAAGRLSLGSGIRDRRGTLGEVEREERRESSIKKSTGEERRPGGHRRIGHSGRLE
jgi:hypothetical protein